MWPGPGGCDEIRHALGVYVLGAIDPAERTVVDRHLATCPDCRDELAGLAGLPALLGRVTLAEVSSLGPDEGTRGAQAAAAQPAPGDPVAGATGHRAPAGPPAPGEPAGWAAAQDHAERPAAPAPAEPPAALLRSILDEAARRRARRRRGAVLAVAAAAVVLAGAGTGVRAWVAGPGAAARPTHPAVASGWQRQVSATNPKTNVTAIVKFSGKSWGTAVDASVEGVGYGTRCVLWASDGTGRHMEIASWTYSDYTSWYLGSSSIHASAVKSFDVTANGHTLVTIPVS